MAILLTKIFVKPHGEIGVAYTNSKDEVKSEYTFCSNVPPEPEFREAIEAFQGVFPLYAEIGNEVNDGSEEGTIIRQIDFKDGVYEGGHPDKVRIKAEMLCKRVLLGFTTITTPWTFPREEDRELFTELINQAFEYIRGKSGQDSLFKEG